uniref:Uncharacterized protein n=1 Tax=candidate division WOR-3 bacterium TaxID=2052148 RepID=A0A7C4U844_UNCW3
MKKVVILSIHPPYGTAINAEAFRASLGLAFSDISVHLVLCQDGVFAALKNQDPRFIQMKSMEEVYKNISSMGINLYIDRRSMEERNIREDEIVNGKIIDEDELKKLIDSADTVLTF